MTPGTCISTKSDPTGRSSELLSMRCVILFKSFYRSSVIITHLCVVVESIENFLGRLVFTAGSPLELPCSCEKKIELHALCILITFQ